MVKLKKTLTNQLTPEDLKAKVDAIDDPETPPEAPSEVPPTPEELDLEEIRAKDPSELTDEEQTFLEENVESLNDEEKVTFNIEGATTPEPPVEGALESPTEPSVPDDTDWKARYRGSTQEAQVLASRNKDLVQSVDEAANLTEPTDEEMQNEFPNEWDLMDNFQKKIAKDNLLNKRRFELVNQSVQKTKKSEEWVGKVKEFTDNPVTLENYPLLKGKEVEFSQFCAIPSRVGVEFDDLVKAFLFDVPPVRPQRKSLFETKGGGEGLKPKGLTPEEVSFLRINDQKKYKELIKAGKIKIEV